MKLNKPEISAKWWSTVKPDNVDGKKILEKELTKAEKSLNEQTKKSDDNKVAENCVSALKGLSIAKITKECDKKKDKDVITALKDLQKLVDKEVDRLSKVIKDIAAGENADDDDEDENKLFDKDYVHKLIKLVKNGKELNFAFGLDVNDPEACDLLLHRKKGADMLWKILKKTKKFPNRLMCFGMTSPDPEDGTTLLFKLDSTSNTPPKRIYRSAKKLFQKDKKLRFKKLKVVAANGQALADDEPEVDENADAAATGSGGVANEERKSRSSKRIRSHRARATTHGSGTQYQRLNLATT